MRRMNSGGDDQVLIDQDIGISSSWLLEMSINISLLRAQFYLTPSSTRSFTALTSQSSHFPSNTPFKANSLLFIKMKFTTILLATAAAVVTTAAPQQPTPTILPQSSLTKGIANPTATVGTFTMKVSNTTRAGLDQGEVNAAGGRFFVGRPANVLCNPPYCGPEYYRGDTTFKFDFGTGLRLDTTGLDIQEVYVDAKTSEIRYTEKDVAPPEALATIVRYNSPLPGESFGTLELGSFNTVQACPFPEQPGQFQLFLNNARSTTPFDTKGCEQVKFQTSNNRQGPGGFQYSMSL